MKYLILIQSNEQSRAVWETLTEAERIEFGKSHLRLTEELLASGELIASEALVDQSLATRVSVRDGRTVTSDGPFAEIKEYVAGFYLVECDSHERAIEIAAKASDAQRCYVELRPVFDIRALDL
ncbi:YciI family protein [Micromonospora sp. NBC_00389]|uniref:YciI family protein n=1 Tax=Micromonospora sp. NBC_00389 TaxID=2903586 RepID=UPI002E206C73